MSLDCNHELQQNKSNKHEFFAWKFKDFLELIRNYIKSPDFASLLEVKTVLKLRLVCKTTYKLFNDEYLRLVIHLGNLEANLRLSFWACNAPWQKYFNNDL